ncbi:MAG: type II toxin-antitoxin system RelE/ParE family toxin [Thermomonas sp.]|uniref:type II toxin-antitoxin system RelE/ParE family toxin n=1 Tax=Thermomonas sp. TaxID=1971895 RepID=UPI0039E51BB0
MFTIRKHEAFEAWFNGLRDSMTKLRLLKRLKKVELGLLGDVQPVGDGVCEMREHFGPGWRMYYIQRETEVILMLGGGDKSTQASDIEAARKLAASLED